MNKYIENLLPRLKRYSADLSRLENFVDLPWIFKDVNNIIHKYIFKRDGDLIISSNGIPNLGTWEYLSVAKSILINHISNPLLLRQFYVDSKIMVLQTDGSNENFILVNENLLDFKNAENYLKEMFEIKYKISKIQLLDGSYLEIEDFENSDNNKVYIEGCDVEDGILTTIDRERKFCINNSKITDIFMTSQYNTKQGLLTIENSYLVNSQIGKYAILNDKIAPDDKYKIGFLDYIYVKNGKVTTKKNYNNS
jgi:hypothetical protein